MLLQNKKLIYLYLDNFIFARKKNPNCNPIGLKKKIRLFFKLILITLRKDNEQEWYKSEDRKQIKALHLPRCLN